MNPFRTAYISDVWSKNVSVTALIAVLFCVVQTVQAQQPSDSRLPQRKTFVPVTDLDVVLSGDREGVLLSRDEFQELYSKARKNEAANPRLPAGVVISDGKYSAEINGDHLVVQATINIHQFQSGWQTLALPFGQLSVEKATVNGEPARLGRTTVTAKAKGQTSSVLTLLHNQTGDATLELELSTLLHASGNDRSAVFQLIPIPSATMDVTVPAGRHLVVGSHSLDRPAPIEQPAVYSVPVGGVINLRLFFNDHQGEQRADSLAFASTGYGLHVAPGEVTWQAKTSLQVFGTTYNQIFCTVPTSLEITDVQSTGLESWELADNPDAADSTLITLNYRQPFDGSRDMVFRGVMATETGKPWAVPNLTLRNVTSHIGRVTVQHPAGVRVRLADSEGARAAAGTTGEQTFDVWREDFNLAFETKTRERELHATVTSLLDLAPTGVTFSAETQVESHFAPLFEVSFRLPAEWRVELIEVDGDSLPWQVSSREAGWNRYRIPLAQPLPPGQELSFRFMSTQDIDDWPVEENSIEFVFPTIEIPQASLVEGTFVIRAGSDLDLKTIDLFNLDPAPSVSSNDQLGFFFQQPDYEGLLTVSRKPSRVSAQSLTFTRLDREVLQSHLQTTLDISGGGLRTLVVELSESAGEDIQFQLSGVNAQIVEQIPGDVDGEFQPWTLNLDQRISGRAVLSVDVTTPRDESKGYDVHRITVPDAERMSGYVAVEGASDQQLEVLTNSASGLPLQTVDPIDVPTPVAYSPRERIVGAYRFNVPGQSVAVSETRFDRVAVPTAVCYSSQIQSVIGRTGELQHRAEFQFVAVGSQSLRVRLPASGDKDTKTELWSTLIDGQPIEVRTNGNFYIVPIPASDQPDQQHKLVLFYRTHESPLSLGGRITQVPPLVSINHSEGAEQRLETLQQSWTLHYPNGTMLTSSTGEFTPERTLDSVSLLGDLRDQFTQIDRTSVLRNGSIAATLFLIVGVIAVSLRRLGVGLLGCAGGALSCFVLLGMFFTFASQEMDSAKHYRESRRTTEGAPAWGTVVGGTDSELAAEFFTQPPSRDDSLPGHGTIIGLASPGSFSEDAPASDPTSDRRYVDDLMEAAPPGKPAGEESDASNRIARQLAIPAPSNSPVPQSAEPEVAKPDHVPLENVDRASNPETAKAPPELITRYNNLFTQRRFSEALAIAKQIKQAAPNDPVSTNAEMKAIFALRNTASDKRRDSKEESFWQQLDDVEQPRKSRSPEIFGDSFIALGDPIGLQNLAGQEAGQAGVGADGERLSRSSMRGRSMSGLLSLSMGLQVPQDSHSVEFRYTGSRTAEAGVGIDVAWQDRDSLDLGRVFLMTAVALFFWLMLSLSVRARAILAVLGIALPLGLISVAPAGLHVFLDGIFLGSLVAVGLWIVRAVLLWTGSRQWLRNLASDSSVQKRASTAVVLIALAGGSSSVNAAEPAAPPIPPEKPATNTVIVPYLAGTDASAAERVLLTREQFIQLWNLAHPDQRVADAAPTKGQVDAAFYECQLNRIDEKNASVQVAATLILHSFRDGQVALPVPLGAVALSESLLDGRPASLVTRSDKSGQHVDVIVSGKGKHTLDLKFAVPAQVDGSVGQFTLPLKAVPSGRVVFRLPEDGLDVRVNGSTSAYRRADSDDGPTIEIPVGNGSPLTVAWRPPEQQGMVASIVHVDSSTAVLIDDVGISESSRISIKVPQGAVSDLSFDLPGELRVRQIAGPHLAGWELNENDGQRQLRVFFNPPVTSATSLDLKLFLDQQQDDTEQTVDLPVVAPRDVTRDTGVIAILASETFQVRSGQVAGLSQIDASQELPLPAVPSASPASVRLAWRYSSRPFDLQVIVGRRQPQSVATIQHAVQVSRRKIHMASLMRGTLRGAPRPSLTFELPEEMLLLSVDATSMSDWYVSESDAANPRTLTIEFESPLLGDLEVVLESQLTKFPNDLVVEFAPPFPLEINRPTAYAGVWFDDAYAATPGDTYGWNPVDPQRIPVELHRRQSKPLQFAFRSTAEEAEMIGFEVGRAQSRLVADAVVMTSVADAFLDYSLALNWRISDAAVDQFTFTTPLWLEDRLNFTGGSIREVTSEVDGEAVRWTIHLQDAVKGRYFVLTTATLPPATKQVDTPAIRFLEPEFDEFGDPVGFNPMESQRQYVLLINQSQAQLTSRHDSSIEPVVASEIPINVDQSLLDQAAELLRIRDTTKLPEWNVRRLEQQAGAPASVNVADLTLSIAADGTWRGEAVYTVRNRRRQFLGVRLPQDARLLSLYVKGKPSRPVMTDLEEQPVHLVPLPKASDSDVSFQVKLVYAGQFESKLPGGFTFRQSELDMPAPYVVTPNDSAEFGIPVARTLWKVHLPKGVDVSVLDSADRTNVTRAGAAESRKAYLSSYEQDLSEMLTILNSSGSGYTRKSRIAASNNTKQIGLAINNYKGVGVNVGDIDVDGEGTAELQKKIAKIEQQLEENREKIDEYANAPAGGTQAVQQGMNPQVYFDDTADLMQRQQVASNNYALILGNGAVGTDGMPTATPQSGPMAGSGSLPQISAPGQQLGEQAPSKDSKPLASYTLSIKEQKQRQAGKAVRKSAEKQVERFSSAKRELRREQSLSTIDGLNSFVDFNNGRGAVQQNEAGASGQGNDMAGPESMFGGIAGGGGGFGVGSMNQQPAQQPNAPADELAELRMIREQEAVAQIIDGSKSMLQDPIFEHGRGFSATPEWTKVGGLSLPIDIPVTEHSMSFSRIGGEPKLALQIRSRELVDTGVGLVWTLVWLGIGAMLVVTFSRVSAARELWQPAVWILFIGGLTSFLVLPSVFSGLGFVAFLLGLLALAGTFVRRGRSAA